MKKIIIGLIFLNVSGFIFSQNQKAISHYHNGEKYMDTHDYVNAEKEFLQALELFYSPLIHWIDDRDRNLFTYDSNGIPREKYFSYYNLACVYSLTNRLTLSMEYLKKALENGYPYISHVYNDSDLKNLLASSSNIKIQIQKIYDDGFLNNISGKGYEWGYASTWFEWDFADNKRIQREAEYISMDNRKVAQYGTYVIKNYHIFATYTIEKGEEAYGFIKSLGGNPIYEGYTPYEKKINEREIISIKEMSELWKEEPLKIIWDIK